MCFLHVLERNKHVFEKSIFWPFLASQRPQFAVKVCLLCTQKTMSDDQNAAQKRRNCRNWARKCVFCTFWSEINTFSKHRFFALCSSKGLNLLSKYASYVHKRPCQM